MNGQDGMAGICLPIGKIDVANCNLDKEKPCIFDAGFLIFEASFGSVRVGANIDEVSLECCRGGHDR
jgi:hypothetical protein